MTTKPKINRLFLILGILAAAAAVAAGGFAIDRAMDPYDNRIVSDVTIGGLDVGGMTKKEARAALTSALEETLLSQELTILLPQETLTVTADTAGLQANVREAVKAAYACGRSGDAPAGEIGMLPYLEYDEAAIRAMLEAYGEKHDTVLSESAYRLEGTAPDLSTTNTLQDIVCQTLVLEKGVAAVTLDVDAVLNEIRRVYDQVLIQDLLVDSSEIIPDAVPEELDLGQIQAEFCLSAVDDAPDQETFSLTHGSYGYTFDLDQAQQLLSEAAYGETVQVPMVCVEPEVLGEEAYFLDLLGQCTTKHGDNENRNTNLRLVCEQLDGFILQPGEEFSYNGVIGERTAERGFKPAPAYSGNRLVDSIGGGVCQTSSTLYNAVLLADLEVVTRYCHGAMVTYLPIGLDAAVNWGTTDFAFRNNFHFPIMIRTAYTDDTITMEIYGTDEKDYYVEMTSSYGESTETYTRAVSYKKKFDKETGELISKETEAFSTYYHY